jgi:hypothetical protein
MLENVAVSGVVLVYALSHYENLREKVGHSSVKIKKWRRYLGRHLIRRLVSVSSSSSCHQVT